jgi:hypothetical protein
MRFFKILSAAGKLTEKFYPQLLGKSTPINTPSWFGMLFAMLKKFAPKKLIEKVSVCRANTTETQDMGTCPFARAFVDPAAFPEFLGGKAPTPYELDVARLVYKAQ